MSAVGDFRSMGLFQGRFRLKKKKRTPGQLGGSWLMRLHVASLRCSFHAAPFLGIILLLPIYLIRLFIIIHLFVWVRSFRAHHSTIFFTRIRNLATGTNEARPFAFSIVQSFGLLRKDPFLQVFDMSASRRGST